MSPPEPASSTPSHDDLVKGLLLRPRLLADFFLAFVPDVLEFADLSAPEYIDKEHPRAGKRPRRAGDVLVKVRWRERAAAFLIHVESESRLTGERILKRACEYALRDSLRYRLDVLPVVLLTSPARTPQPDAFAWEFGAAAWLRFRCPLVHFSRLDPAPHLAGSNAAAAALSSLMALDRSQQVEAIAQTLAASLRQRLEGDDLDAALAFVLHYAPLDPEQLLQLDLRLRILSSQEPLLAPMPALLNPFVELGKLKGRQEGREEGHQEGREEGRGEGERSVVSRLLACKFPALAAELAEPLRSLPEDRLLAFAEALLFLETEAEVRDWLA